LANNYALEKPAKRARVIALVLEGKSDAQVAAAISTPKCSVSRQAITKFRARHADELQPAIAEIEKQITDYAIAKQVNRIADAQLRRDLLYQVREIRSNGGEGMETGIVVRTYKQIGAGEDAKLVEEYRVDTAMLAEWRANDRYVAEVLDQLPRANMTVDLSDHRSYTLVVQKPDDRIAIG
jgi:hypothetical protein